MNKQFKRYQNEDELAAFLCYLADKLNDPPMTLHEDCECELCLFDNMIGMALSHVHELFHSQIILLKANRMIGADLMVRPIAESVIDFLFINLNLPKRLPMYLAHDCNFDIYRCKRQIDYLDKQKNLNKEEQVHIEELQSRITDLEEFLCNHKLPKIEKPTQWVNYTLAKKLEEIRDSRIYCPSIQVTLEENIELTVKFIHSITHSSGIQIRRGYHYHVNNAMLDDPLFLSIDWIMILLEFLNSHFEFLDLTEDIKKYYRYFYQ